MRKIISILQVIASAFILCWTTYMTIRSIFEGNELFLTILFGVMTGLSIMMLAISINEMKGDMQ